MDSKKMSRMWFPWISHNLTLIFNFCMQAATDPEAKHTNFCDPMTSSLDLSHYTDDIHYINWVYKLWKKIKIPRNTVLTITSPIKSRSKASSSAVWGWKLLHVTSKGEISLFSDYTIPSNLLKHLILYMSSKNNEFWARMQNLFK